MTAWTSTDEFVLRGRMYDRTPRVVVLEREDDFAWYSPNCPVMTRALTGTQREKALHHAQRQVEAKIADIGRALTSLKFWRRRVAYYEREVALTPEERAARVEAQRTRVLQRRRRVRHIVV